MNKRDKENNNKKERDWNEREENEKRIKTVVDLNYAAIKVPPTKARMEIEGRGFFADSFFFSIFPRSIRSSKCSIEILHGSSVDEKKNTKGASLN